MQIETISYYEDLLDQKIIEDLELTWSEETEYKIGGYIFDDDQGQWRISDYAMDQLEDHRS